MVATDCYHPRMLYTTVQAVLGQPVTTDVDRQLQAYPKLAKLPSIIENYLVSLFLMVYCCIQGYSTRSHPGTFYATVKDALGSPTPADNDR